MKAPKTLLPGMVVLIACSVQLQIRASPCAQSTQTGKVAGLVLDANDARIADATISLSSGRFTREVRSDSDGAFAIALPAGTYRLTVDKDGFRKCRLSSVRVPAQASEQMRVKMQVREPPGIQKLGGTASPVDPRGSD